MSDISYPFQICGFEILDYSSHGYQKDSRFFVNGYEDGKLSFFCENFEIFYTIYKWIKAIGIFGQGSESETSP